MTTLRLLLPLVVGLLSGCAALFPRVDVADTKPVDPPEPAPAAAAPTGAIFQAASYRPLFEDRRARLVGDTLTVAIAERISATQKSSSSINKSGKSDASISALPGIASKVLARASVEGSSSSAYAGKGSTENSNDFTGTITVIVTKVLANGNLVIAGEKQIGVNDNVDVLRFSGQVDARAIQPGNVVPSTQIANVRLEQRGRGPQAEAQAVGWLARVFLSFLPL